MLELIKAACATSDGIPQHLCARAANQQLTIVNQLLTTPNQLSAIVNQLPTIVTTRDRHRHRRRRRRRRSIACRPSIGVGAAAGADVDWLFVSWWFMITLAIRRYQGMFKKFVGVIARCFASLTTMMQVKRESQRAVLKSPRRL
jgi:hypothetical protein